MTSVVSCPNPSAVRPICSNDAIDELKNHPAYYSLSNEEMAETLLKGTPPMTYILWTKQITINGQVSEQYYLSFMETSLTVEHRTFSHPDNWFYMNCDPHSADKLLDLIPQMMHCKLNQCQMLINPNRHPTMGC
ncbi:MAG TPA: hypothetical protein VIJ14_01130 [Rhabdochlamydiaceae bacterium]